VGGLERRIKNLEAALVGEECSECGYDPQAPITYEVVFDDPGETEGPEDEPEGPEFCEGCGQQLNTIIVFDDPAPRVSEREELRRDE
jgi:hypothetical protein